MNVIFVCHGNICRSPMAEYLFIDMLARNRITGVNVCSRATSFEEDGNPCHYGTRKILENLNIDCSTHRAQRITRAECDWADMLVCMDQYNVWHLESICGKGNEPKIKKLLEFSERYEDIDDPWYTHDFKKCYREISDGLNGLLRYIKTINR